MFAHHAGATAVMILLSAAAPGTDSANRTMAAGPVLIQAAAQGASMATPAHRYLINNLLVTRPRIIRGGADPSTALAYVTIVNRGDTPDTLTGASIEGADKASLEETTAGAQPAFTIRGGQTLDMEVGGPHLILTGLHHAINAGDRIAGILQFEKAGPLSIDFEVEDPTGPSPQP